MVDESENDDTNYYLTELPSEKNSGDQSASCFQTVLPTSESDSNSDLNELNTQDEQIMSDMNIEEE